jgi:hypothetical protein
MTASQKQSDMRMLADRLAKNYAPYEWKKRAVNFDMLHLTPWLQRAAETKSDLEFYDLCAEYVASLVDAHTSYRLPSTFNASLGFTTDLYEGKVLIDSIDRLRLPEASFPAALGDELVSVDGEPVDAIIKRLERYAISGNPVTRRRDAASSIPARSQVFDPYAHRIPAESELVLRSPSGETKTLKAPWRKRGRVLDFISAPPPVTTGVLVHRGIDYNSPDGFRDHLRLRENLSLDRPGRELAVRGFALRDPLFAMPEGYESFLGAARTDSLFGGVIPYNDRRVAYIRIPQFSGFRMETEFQRFVDQMKENSHVLVIDVTRNPGGSACLLENMARRLMTDPWKVIAGEQTVLWRDILSLESAIASAELFGTPEEIAQLRAELAEYEKAFRENNGRTRPLPFCSASVDQQPLKTLAGDLVAYNKPILVLIDEFSISAAEHFAALLQDNGRAKLFGKRTTGAGGAVLSTTTGVYSEAQVSITWSLSVRPRAVNTEEYGEVPYLENVGARPDFVYERNTAENLRENDKPFVKAFLDAALSLLP